MVRQRFIDEALSAILYRRIVVETESKKTSKKRNKRELDKKTRFSGNWGAEYGLAGFVSNQSFE